VLTRADYCAYDVDLAGGRLYNRRVFVGLDLLGALLAALGKIRFVTLLGKRRQKVSAIMKAHRVWLRFI